MAMPRVPDPLDCSAEIEKRVVDLFELVVEQLPADHQARVRAQAQACAASIRATWDARRHAGIDADIRRLRHKVQKARDGQQSAEAALNALRAEFAPAPPPKSRSRSANGSIALG
jgi:hypothetical protein